MVGDEDQTIYSWRGASATSMGQKMDSDYGAVETYELKRNFRSTAAIVRASTHVVRRLGPVSDSGSGAVAVAVAGAEGIEGKEGGSDSDSVQVVNSYSDPSQSTYVAQMVQYLLQSKEVTQGSEIAVMYVHTYILDQV